MHHAYFYKKGGERETTEGIEQSNHEKQQNTWKMKKGKCCW